MNFIYPSITQQHRSLNDLTNKNSNKGKNSNIHLSKKIEQKEK